MLRVATLLVLMVVAMSCAQPVLRRDWSDFTGPGAEAFHQEALPPPNFPDPLEPVNRSVWTFNHALIVGVAAPVGHVYRVMVPRFVRDGIVTSRRNLVYPRNLVANLLQGHGREAGQHETARFALNTTVGLGGLWDPATRWLGIAAAPGGLRAGVRALGLASSTSCRCRSRGRARSATAWGCCRTRCSTRPLFFPAALGLEVRRHGRLDPRLPPLHRAQLRRLDDARLLWSLAREARIEEPDLDTRRATTPARCRRCGRSLLGPRDPTSSASLHRGSRAGRPGLLPYSDRMQDGQAPLIFLVPGLGAHRLAGSKRGARRNGVGSRLLGRHRQQPVQPRVHRTGAGACRCRDIGRSTRTTSIVALDEIERDLGREYPERIGSRVFLGYSLGAFPGFYIAAGRGRSGHKLRALRPLPVARPARAPARRHEAARRVRRRPARAAPGASAKRRSPHPAEGRGGRQGARSARTAPRLQYGRLETADLGGGTLTPDAAAVHERGGRVLDRCRVPALAAGILFASQGRQDLGVLLTERRRYAGSPPTRRSATTRSNGGGWLNHRIAKSRGRGEQLSETSAF